MECAGPASYVFDPTLTDYDFGAGHPMSPVRVDLTIRLAEELGVLDALERLDAPVATDDEVASVHARALIAAVKRAGETLEPDLAHGLGSDDNPVFRDMHRAG